MRGLHRLRRRLEQHLCRHPRPGEVDRYLMHDWTDGELLPPSPIFDPIPCRVRFWKLKIVCPNCGKAWIEELHEFKRHE